MSSPPPTSISSAAFPAESELPDRDADTTAASPPDTRADDWPLLSVLCISHFFNDMCLGITAPMVPAMESRFGMTLGAVAGLVVIITLMANFSQPVAGWFMARSRTPWILLLCPLVSGVSMLVGFAETPAQAAVLFFISGLAIGTFHPYAFILAQIALPRRPAFSSSVFISFGFLGVSSGAMISGHWMEHLGFENFHLLYFLSAAVVVSLLIRGIQSVDLAGYTNVGGGGVSGGQADGRAAGADGKRQVPFGLLFVIGLLLAIEGGTFLFFNPKLFKILFDSEGQGGNAGFIFGLAGGISSYVYAWFADRGNSLRVVLVVQILAIAPLFGFFEATTAGGKLFMMLLIGSTLGGCYPLIASLARHARGLSVSMRSALMLGGVWGTASVIQYAMAQLPDRGHDLQEVMGVIRFVPFLVILILFHASRAYETRAPDVTVPSAPAPGRRRAPSAA